LCVAIDEDSLQRYGRNKIKTMQEGLPVFCHPEQKPENFLENLILIGTIEVEGKAGMENRKLK